jgi:hypothetical protein
VIEDEPNLVHSGKSPRVVVDGYPFSIKIYRMETDKTWTLEVVDHEGTSHVWDEHFGTEKDARNAALAAIKAEGAFAFMRGDTIIPFRKPRYLVRQERRLPLTRRHSPCPFTAQERAVERVLHRLADA